ncbi:hypothetical protein N665_1049s0002 [Sinapis alba]|nr:hypothetical protein N665_1049s0002 [Sinapis alba]
MKYGNVNVWTFPIIFLLLCSSRVFYLHGGLSLSLNILDNIWSLDCLHRRCHTKDVEMFSKYKLLKVTPSSISASTS